MQKGRVLDELNKYVLNARKQTRYGTPGTNGVAVLASRDFTSWLEDENFMSTFLETLVKPMSTTQAKLPSLHMLAGITDGLVPHRLSSESHSGFSVLYGQTDDILPGLWEKEGFAGTSHDSTSCVSFVTNPLVGDSGTLEIALPLANTVFQNGRRSTLYASTWDISSEDSIALRMRNAKTTQRIILRGDPVNHTSSIIPLLPLTPPRKIVAALGNIIRQVDVDGSITPASKELEAIIPEIFEERAQRNPNSSPRPIGVWCWVIPPHVVEAMNFDKLKLFKAGSSHTEADIVRSSAELFSELLSSGCRLHKIRMKVLPTCLAGANMFAVSGGGGWGLKQGLLSLDPETSFSLPGEDDDIEMFIRSFEERNSADQTGGLATPGSSLIFCVELQTTDSGAASSQLLTPTYNISFGVAPNADQTPTPSSHPSHVEIIDGHFGVSSAAGLFLRSAPEFNGSTGTKENGPFSTKVDVPGACFCI
jgi:hypothetical protein